MLENCDCLTAKYKHLLLPLEDEQEFKDELEFTPFNFCPFCGSKIKRDDSWFNATVGSGGDCENCEDETILRGKGVPTADEETTPDTDLRRVPKMSRDDSDLTFG
jgi:hypothetical protein